MDLEKNLVKSQKRVSNLENCVNIIMDFAANLPKAWGLMAYKDKQLLQFLLFPEGIRYSKKINQCRTTKVNSVFTYIAHLVRDMAEIKKGDTKLLFDIPHLVVPPVTYLFCLNPLFYWVLPLSKSFWGHSGCSLFNSFPYQR